MNVQQLESRLQRLQRVRDEILEEGDTVPQMLLIEIQDAREALANAVGTARTGRLLECLSVATEKSDPPIF